MAKARITASLRKAVLTRDNHICRACGFGGSVSFAPYLDCDHAVSERDGGATTIDNLQCLCKACNIAKAGASWSFVIRVCSVSESVWSHNHKVMGMAFIQDTAARLRKLR